MSDGDGAAERITELEIRIAHQERSIEDLGDVVLALSGEVDTLKRLVRHLRERFDESLASGPLPDETPQD